MKNKLIDFNNISFSSICLVAMTMSFPMAINTYLIIFAVLINLFVFIKRKGGNFKLVFNKIDFLFFGYYLLIIVSFFYNENYDIIFKKLEYNLSFLIIPLFFVKLKSLNKSEINKLMSFYTLGVIFTSIIFIALAFYKYYYLNKSISVFFYHSLSSPFQLHAVYYSYYVFLAIVILSFYDYKKIEIRYRIIIILFLLIILILLSSKSVLLFLGLFTMLSILMKMGKIKKYLRYIVVISLGLILSFIMLGRDTVLFKRFENVLDYSSYSIILEDSMTDFEKVNGLTLRLMFAKYSIMETIKSPSDVLIGQGYGDKQDFLDTVYEKHNMARSTDGEILGYYGYNTHNQYVESYITSGIIGLLFLINLLILCFVRMRNNIISLSFILLICWSCLFESVLVVNKGIIFFVFWTIFFYNNFNENSDIRYEGSSQ